jgi:transcriptional regulator with XRE-family HTH domain
VCLRELRKDAGLTGRALAAATGQHYTRVSKIENGVQPPSDQDIRAWCRTCGAEDQIGTRTRRTGGAQAAVGGDIERAEPAAERLGDDQRRVVRRDDHPLGKSMPSATCRTVPSGVISPMNPGR